MSILRTLACLSLLAAPLLLQSQASPPTAYTITEAIGSVPGGTTTLYRSGSKILVETNLPAQGETPASKTRSLYDLETHTNITWDPNANPPACGGAGRFSGDWGDPFGLTSEISDDIAKGDLKPAGTETLAGISAQVYTGVNGSTSMKVWVDNKDGLVLRATISSAGSPTLTLADIQKISFAPPPASLFVLPAVCAGVKPPPTTAELIAAETDDDPANYANGSYGPGSTNTCSVVLRVVKAKTMEPIAHVQVAIDTSIYADNAPPAYTFGVRDDGSQTYSGGHILEITNRVHNGVARLGLPPERFYLGVNLIQPGHGGSMGLVYRHCFAPTTVLLEVVNDYLQPTESVDLLWVKSGKYAAPPAQ